VRNGNLKIRSIIKILLYYNELEGNNLETFCFNKVENRELVQGIRKNDNIYKHSTFIDYLSFLIVSPLSIIQNQIIFHLTNYSLYILH